ncbi:glycosyltransferase [Pseudomonas sp. SWRI79]|uniref:Glycosyltransferase n=1 Tax=Pseudomonas farris TaxID=2841207 RepID=A0ABS6PMN4_9PSED|nr:glycosyltransferase [Pseudomonas farris]MBV4461730.1 glycosyltransferase [Pseudomonas farris]
MNTKKIIIVLGMHRSGTSALTRGLSTLGVALGDALHPPGPDNPTGFWEDSDVIAINNQILGLLGSAHDRMGVIDANVFDLPGIQQIYQTAKELVEQKTASTSIWGMKDPRITRLLPFWKKLLNELGFKVGYVIALRNPLNVAASLTARNQLAPVKSYVLWLEHMLQAVASTQSENRLVVGYDNLLSDPYKQLQRISAALDLCTPTQEQFDVYADEFLDKGLRHGQHNDDELFNSNIEPAILAQTYQLLRECALDELNINSAEFVQQLDPLMSALRRMLPMLQLVSQAEAATVAANEGIVARDRHIEALNVHINSLSSELEELKASETRQATRDIALNASEAEQRARFTALQIEQTSRYITLAASKAEQASLNSALENSLIEQTARNVALKSELEERQSALDLVIAQKQALDQQTSHLTLSLSAAQNSLLTASEQINTLSNTWATFFVSRTWRSLRFFGKDTGKPVIMLPNGSQFDDCFYLSHYPDVAASGMSAREHFLGAGLREGRAASAELVARPLSEVHRSPVVKESEAPIEPASPVALPEVFEADASDKGMVFDVTFYLAMYPDIANCGMDPQQHFLMHGQHEGRIGSVPTITLSRSIDAQDNSKQTVLLVSHEASRTGAPILSLNIAQQLTERFNVVALLLGPGSLTDAFVDAGAIVAGPLDRNNPVGTSWAVAEFLDKYRIDFAIVNSLESNLALKPLADRYIPSVSLIHEFAVYTRPRSAIQNALLWASQTVFSSDVTLDSAVQVLPQLNDCSIPVLAQGKSIVPAEARDEAQVDAERLRLQHAIRPQDQDADTIIILGAGRVQVRKGVDIFIECATRVINSPIGHKCRFVWIGDNYNPETDIAYSVYLYDQIQRSGIAEQFTIISETAQIEEVYAMSDMLLLSSRLDPLPNVAIDAMVRGLPVLCFDRTTGIADILKRNDLETDCIAPYLDTGSMADKIIRLASSDSARANVGAQVKAIAAREFNMANYVEKLVDIATSRGETSQFEKLDTATIAEAGVLDISFYTPAKVALEDEASAIRRYVRSWSRGVLRRKPFPGFDPSLYQELNADAVGQHDPLAHFLRAGRPQGPWNSNKLDWAKPHQTSEAHKALLFVSIELPEQLLNVLDQIMVSGIDVTVIVQTNDESTRLALQNALSKDRNLPLDIQVCERGTLSALLSHLTTADYQEFDLIGHLDLQAEPVDSEFTSQVAYHRYLIENMIDGEHLALRTIANHLTERNSVSPIGLVFPEDPTISHLSQDSALVNNLCKAIGLQPPRHEHLPYPINGVFWSVPATLSPLVNELPRLKSAIKEMHLSPLVEDRILARMLPLACASKEMLINTTVVAGVTY